MSFLFGSSKETTSIPEWMREAIQSNMADARRVAGIGYVPYRGPDVAAFTPMQEAAMRNTNAAASAFGMAAPSNPLAGMPAPQTFAGGVRGYSSAPMYDQAISEMRSRNPQQYQAIMDLLQSYRTPMPTGTTPQGGIPPQGGVSPMPPQSGGEGGPPAGPPHSGGSIGNLFGGNSWGASSGGSSGGGFTSIGDMFDGGGPGASGNRFSGGLLSGAANALGISPRQSSTRR